MNQNQKPFFLSLPQLSNSLKSTFCFSFLIFSMISSVSSARPAFNLPIMPDIVGGVDALENEFSFIVSLQVRDKHICGGSLVAPNWVLTAAHCVKEPGYPVTKVIIGMNNQTLLTNVEMIEVEKIYVHPKYSRPDKGYDVALIRLKSASTYKPIELIEEQIQFGTESHPDQVMAEVIGWGLKNQSDFETPDKLQKVNVPLVSQDTCNKPESYNGTINETMLCAGYPEGLKDSCQGDSGGPLVMDTPQGKKQIGIVSWGYGCAQPNLYGVYSNVSSLYLWILDILTTPAPAPVAQPEQTPAPVENPAPVVTPTT